MSRLHKYKDAKAGKFAGFRPGKDMEDDKNGSSTSPSKLANEAGDYGSADNIYADFGAGLPAGAGASRKGRNDNIPLFLSAEY